MFESFYNSAWNHPGAAWASAFIMLLVVLRRLPFFWAFVIGALALTSADAMITGGFSRLSVETSTVRMLNVDIVPILSFFFVLFGDWRLYLFTERFSGTHGPAVWLRSGAIAIIPSFLVFVIGKVWVDAFAQSRVLYLTYEVIFIVLALLYYATVLRARLSGLGTDTARWLKIVFGFFLVGYAGWAISDIIILSGQEWGHGLRIVPNLMYYAGIIPLVYFTAPSEERSWSRS